MNDRRILQNIGISMVMKPISILLSFVYTPLLLGFLGVEKYGVWVIIMNIISWINYFDIGIGNGLKNKLAEAIALEDTKTAKRFVSTAYLGTFIISVAFFIIISLLWKLLNLSVFFKLTIEKENIDGVVIISILFVCINFVLSLSKTTAYALQKPGIISVIGVIGQGLQIIGICIVSKIWQQNLMAIALLYGFISLVDSFVLFFIVSRNRSYLRPSVSDIDKQCLKPLLTLGAGFFIMQISTLILNTTDNLLISNLYGSAEVTPYSVVYKVFYMSIQIHAIIIMPMWSAYTAAAVNNDYTWMKKTLKKVNLITLFFSVCVLIGVLVFEPFAKYWLHKELEYGKPLIILVALYMIIQMFANNYSSFLCGVGDIKVSTIIAVISAVLNIPLSIVFANAFHMRLSGIILGSFVVMMISFIALPVVTKRWFRQRGVPISA